MLKIKGFSGISASNPRLFINNSEAFYGRDDFLSGKQNFRRNNWFISREFWAAWQKISRSYNVDGSFINSHT